MGYEIVPSDVLGTGRYRVRFQRYSVAGKVWEVQCQIKLELIQFMQALGGLHKPL